MGIEMAPDLCGQSRILIFASTTGYHVARPGSLEDFIVLDVAG
jgi:hypothetical protein